MTHGGGVWGCCRWWLCEGMMVEYYAAVVIVMFKMYMVCLLGYEHCIAAGVFLHILSLSSLNSSFPPVPSSPITTTLSLVHS